MAIWMHIFLFLINIILVSGFLRNNRYLQVPIYGEVRVKIGTPGIFLHLTVSFDFTGIILIDANCGKRDRICPRHCEDNEFAYLYCHPNCKAASSHENALICNAREPTLSDEVTIVVHRYNTAESKSAQQICSKCSEWRGKAAGCRPLFGRLYDDVVEFPRIFLDEDRDEVMGPSVLPDLNITLISATAFDRRALTKPDGLFGLGVGSHNPAVQLMKTFNTLKPIVSFASIQEVIKHQIRSSQIMTIGYYDRSRCGPFTFVPTVTKDKWIFSIENINFMGMNLTEKSLGLLSQDFDVILMARSAIDRLTDKGPLLRAADYLRYVYYESPCVQIGYKYYQVAMRYGDVNIKIKGGFNLKLTARSLYFRPASEHRPFCVLSTAYDNGSPFGNANVWTFGTVIMNDYCVALDYEKHEIGFAPLRLRGLGWLLTSFILIGFVVMVYVQTGEAFQRFIDPSSKPVPRYEASQTDPVPRPGYIVCFDRQSNSVLRGYGSLDFRLLFFEFAKSHPNAEMFQKAELEYYRLERLFSNNGIDEEEIELLKTELQYFPEIRLLLSMDAYSADPYVWLQLDSFRALRELRFSLDDCWNEYARRSQRSEFIRCRYEKAKRRFEEFSYFNENFFEYFYNTSMRFEDIFLNVTFSGNVTFEHETGWHPVYGPCETIYPTLYNTSTDYNVYTEDNVQSEMRDTLLIRTNYYEAARGEFPLLYLYNPGRYTGSNELRLTPGEYVRIEVVGFETVKNELCENSFDPICSKYQNSSAYYTWKTCRWCELWSQTCNCAVPMKFHSDVTLKNCTMFDAMKCMIRYDEAASRGTKCVDECERETYVISTQHEPLTPEMIPDSQEDRIIEESRRLTRAINDYFTFPQDSPLRIFRAFEDIYGYISQYYNTMRQFYKVIYGDDFKMSVMYLENMDGFPPLDEYNFAGNYPLNDCDYETLKKPMETFAEDFFVFYQNWGIQEEFDCVVSIDLHDCYRVLTYLNRTEAVVTDALEDGETINLRVYMYLMITVNATINPMSFFRSYEVSGGNIFSNLDRMKTLRRSGKIVQSTVNTLLSNETHLNDSCLLRLNNSINEFLETKSIANAEEVYQGMIWLANEYTYFSLYDNFTTRSSAMVEIYFYPYTRQTVIYPADYNFWTFLAEFGGVLGLYFGVTVITIYETIFFFFSEPDTVQSIRQPERRFSAGAIYADDKNYDHSLAVPR